MKAKDFSLDKSMACTNVKDMKFAFDGKDLMTIFNVPEEDQLEILKLIHGEDDLDENGVPMYSNVGATTEIEIIAANLGLKVIVFDEYNDRYGYYV